MGNNNCKMDSSEKKRPEKKKDFNGLSTGLDEV